MNVLLAPNSHSILTSSRLAIRPTALLGILLTAVTYVLALVVFFPIPWLFVTAFKTEQDAVHLPLLVFRTDALELSQCDPERWPRFLDDLTRRGFVHNPRVRTRIACRLCPGGRRVGTKQGHPSLDPKCLSGDNLIDMNRL